MSVLNRDLERLRADAVISIGCDLSGLPVPRGELVRWDEVPSPSEDFARADEAIRKRVTALIEELVQARPGKKKQLQEILKMRVQSRLFSSNSKSWEALCDEAAAFASEVGRDRLINISVAASGGTEFLGMGGTGVVIVWYWE